MGSLSRRVAGWLAGWTARPGARTVITLIRRSVFEFRDDHCSQLAAAISYHVLFALFPLAILATAIVALVTQKAHAQEIITHAILRAVPLSSHGRHELSTLLGSAGGAAGALGLLGIAGVVWSSSGVMAAMRTALNTAWDTDSRRPFLRGKAVDLLLVAGTFVVVGAAFGVTLLASVIRHGSAHLPSWLRGFSPVVTGSTEAGAILLVSALLFAVFLGLYRVVPAVHTRLRNLWPGALVAAFGFEAAQWGFSVYVANFGHYNKIYGSLGGIVAFMFFVYLASAVFLFGAEVASEYPRLSQSHRGPADAGATTEDEP